MKLHGGSVFATVCVVSGFVTLSEAFVQPSSAVSRESTPGILAFLMVRCVDPNKHIS